MVELDVRYFCCTNFSIVSVGKNIFDGCNLTDEMVFAFRNQKPHYGFDGKDRMHHVPLRDDDRETLSKYFTSRQQPTLLSTAVSAREIVNSSMMCALLPSLLLLEQSNEIGVEEQMTALRMVDSRYGSTF